MGRSAKRNQNRGKFPQKTVDLDKDVDDVDPNSSRYIYDEIDQFHAKRDGIDLSDQSAAEENDLEAQNVDVDDGMSEEDMEYVDNDETKYTSVIPSSKAWGRKKADYYGGEDVSGVRGFEREELEDAEEEEALKIQQRLAEEIDEDQFELFQVPETPAVDSSTKPTNEIVDIDIKGLSVKAQWKLVKQESPELKELISDFKAKSNDLKLEIWPLLNLVRAGKITGNGAIYAQTRFNLCLAYLLNISFYMSLKAKRQSMVGHPVIKRLLQYRTILNKLSRLDKKLEDDIKTVLNNESEAVENSPAFDHESDELIEDGDDDDDDDDEVVEDIARSQPSQAKQPTPQVESKEFSFVPLTERLRLEEEREKEREKAEALKASGETKDEEEDRREVNDLIKKNKGFVNKRKKKLGNPRARNREKYRKAVVRRKGQVRDFQPELVKYSGEATGIRAGVIRSRPIG